ncbi:hypothetical protein A2673_03040 [Candidatus Kaiserbacteria bacterium RIFCSPHIGHO2_01_FULL_50_13]|uniref:DUF5667 domain-containing protein n=1 Tax=Candidatus Kaiserbacteria bacterium RIFCSPLOWO2_01_FULL_50_24 TaxID=1798507 RepID=A0A1F6ERE9_9BACT|nr:MAG: hypothetical protein A2673_03040 [Candidatus Kaiserbacteria bacterium RIFCSPHIGHO2_01_FULL_50_13]OGG76200.1 MAG: hypothetical protein A3A34_01775 [Candidatus Kaiserbacteria bacterium RIFCSPLOWO2_01_FULL_50_24]OGG81125.1 MAG: hypothetical protein A3H74_01565 [Candidatus Kaiserbacteria bacterium RIFCSPLOWO2_02_FULL_51_13]
MSIRFAIPVALSLALVLFSWSVAFAEESSAEASAGAEATAEVKAERTEARPLQLLKDIRANLFGERRDVKEEIKAGREEERGIRADIKAERDATVEVRKEMRAEEQERRADVRTDVKAETNIEVRKEMRVEEQERRADVRADMQEKREEMRDGLRARVHNLLRAQLGAIVNRLTVSLRYFDTMVGRIESRIEKLSDRGLDVAGVEASLAVAVDLIVTAKVDVQAIVDVVEGANDTSDPASLKAELRSAITKAVASVKAAHRALIGVAREMVALVRASASVDANVEVEVDTEN